MQVAGLQQQLFATRKDRDELMEANNELRRSLEAVEMQLRDTDSECNRWVWHGGGGPGGGWSNIGDRWVGHLGMSM